MRLAKPTACVSAQCARPDLSMCIVCNVSLPSLYARWSCRHVVDQRKRIAAYRYEGGNYQGKDMAHVQKALSTSMTGHAMGEGMKAHIARLALGVLPR
jgi:hypothetical protein